MRRWTAPVALLATPLGRRRAVDRVRERSGKLTRRLAGRYRRTLVRRTRLIAVVGSFGKTSTTRAVVAALGGEPHRTLDRNSNAVLSRAVLRIRPGARWAALEVAINAPRQMARLARLLRPDVVVVTTIGSEHNRTLLTLEATRHEKAEMVRALGPAGLAVLNGDDPNVRWMAGETPARVVTFGLEPGNDVRAADVVLDWPRGTRFTLHAGGAVRRVAIRTLGRDLVYPALAAVAVALAEGRTLDEALPPLEALPPTPRRLEAVALPDGAFLLRDDCKSHEETIRSALDVLAQVPGRRIVVMGGITEPRGNQHRLHRAVGGRIAAIAERVVFVAEKFGDYGVGARRAGMASDSIVNAGASARAAAEAVRADLRPGDVVLVKGRDIERLERVGLALAGRDVRCDIPICRAAYVRCEECPMLERGWVDRPVAT